jgi:hypothetical protein
MHRVKFTQVEEFTEELARDGPPSKIVRVTRLYRPMTNLPFRTATLLAAFIDKRGELVELRRYIGDVIPGDHPDNERIHDETNRHQEHIETTAKALGHEVRAGMFEETTQ